MVPIKILTLALLLPLPCQSIHLDIHIPLPQGCLKDYAMLANKLLREASRSLLLRPSQSKEDAVDEPAQPSEEVNLFSLHTPHITLYLSDFDLEVDGADAQQIDGSGAAAELNRTKIDSFLNVLSSLNYTEIIAGQNCHLSFAIDKSTHVLYTINGDYTMIPIENAPCIQNLSNSLLHSLQSFLRYPIVVPSWVAELPEPTRSAAINRVRSFGSPNVEDGFDPHVTVGFDPNADLQWRDDSMKHWNDDYQQVHGTCTGKVQGIAVGKIGVGGTVLANSRMGYWNVAHDASQEGSYATVQ